MTPRERPILFSGEMVRAILGRKKTQTRRVIKPQPDAAVTGLKPRTTYAGNTLWCNVLGSGKFYELDNRKCPYGQPGDTLWVRETWAALHPGTDRVLEPIKPQPGVCTLAYRATDTRGIVGNWRPSIFMPRWASRITLEVTSVRVGKVQDITDDDAIEEGVDRTNTSIPTYARQRFQKLWDSINQSRGFGWDTNCWVWVVQFRVVSP